MASTIQVDTIKDIGGNTMISSNGSGTFTSNLPGVGKIGQVVQVAKTDTYSESIPANSLSSTIVSGLQPSITPSASNSKVLITVTLSVGYASNAAGDQTGFIMKRGSTGIALGNADGSRTRLSTGLNFSSTYTLENMSMTFLDSPSTTSSITYGISLFNGGGSTNNVYLNRDDRNDNGSYTSRGISSITLMEVLV